MPFHDRVFTVEAVLRIIALEGFSPYISDSWNQLDFFCVVSGWVTEAPGLVMKLMDPDSETEAVKFTAFRAFRALRVLRTMKFLTGMRDIVDTFGATIPMVLQAMLVYFYFLFLYAVFGLEVWGVALDSSCTVAVANGTRTALAVPRKFCVAGDVVCTGEAHACTAHERADRDFTGFSNFLVSLVTNYRISQRAGMGFILHGVMETKSRWSIAYFATLMIFVNFVILALFIAIVRATFSKVKKKADAVKAKKAKVAQVGRKWQQKAHEQAAARAEEAPTPAPAKTPGGKLFYCVPHSNPLVTLLARLIAWPYFDHFISLCIAVNSAFLAFEYYEQPQSWTDLLKTFEVIFTVVFTAEMVFKIIGLKGVHPYLVGDDLAAWNRFDCSIVIASLVDVTLQATGGAKFINLSLFRVFRLLRILRLLRRNPDIIKILTAMVASLPGMANLGCFFLLCSIVFAILGMQLYGGQLGEKPPRSNFDTFPNAMVTLFKMTSGGGTYGILYNCMSTPLGWTAPFFFMSYAVFAIFIIINFLVVIIMQNFGMTPAEKDARRRERLRKVAAKLAKRFERQVDANLEEVQMATIQDLLDQAAAASGGPEQPAAAAADGETATPAADAKDAEEKGKGKEEGAKEQEEKEKGEKEKEAAKGSAAPKRARRKTAADLAAEVVGSAVGKATSSVGGLLLRCGCVKNPKRLTYAFLVLPPSSAVRRFCKYCVERPWFDPFIIVAIVISSGFLTLESAKYKDDATLQLVMLGADWIFMIVFAIECVLKIVAYGFIVPRDGYINDPWNRLDFFVVIITFLAMFGGGSSAGRTLRVGRILRPLRMIQRNEGMKVIVDVLLRALMPVFYLTVLLLAFFFVFAILGLDLFSGKFWRCNDLSKDIITREDCVGHFKMWVNEIEWKKHIDDYKAYVYVPRVWSNPPYFSFDNIGLALQTLFEVVARKGWTPVLDSAMDVTDLGLQPKKWESKASVVYFIVFIYFGAYFMLKLFVGIIVGTFRQFSGTALLTPSQVRWLNMKRCMRNVRQQLAVPKAAWRRRAFEAVSWRHFDLAVTCCIFAHLGFLALQHPGMSADVKTLLIVVHWVFTAVYIAELLLKLAAMGATRFFRQSLWNVYDGVVVALMVILPAFGMYQGAGFMRALRFTRVIAFFSKLKGIEHLFNVVIGAIPAMLNATALFFMVQFVFAVMGMQLFQLTKKGLSLSAYADFDTFPAALLTLFQICSGEDWKLIMNELAVEAPRCIRWSFASAAQAQTYADKMLGGAENMEPAEGVLEDCGNSFLSVMFFFMFFVLVFCIFLNLYVATILDTYASMVDDGTQWHVTAEDFERYCALFEQYDPRQTGFIRVSAVRSFVAGLGAPLGFDPYKKEHIGQFLLLRIHLTRQGRAHTRGGGETKAAKKGAQANKVHVAGDDGEKRKLPPKRANTLTRFGLEKTGALEAGAAFLGAPRVGFYDFLRELALRNLAVESMDVQERAIRCGERRAVEMVLAAIEIQQLVRGAFFRHFFEVVASGAELGGDATGIPADSALPADSPPLFAAYVQKVFAARATSGGKGDTVGDGSVPSFWLNYARRANVRKVFAKFKNMQQVSRAYTRMRFIRDLIVKTKAELEAEAREAAAKQKAMAALLSL